MGTITETVKKKQSKNDEVLQTFRSFTMHINALKAYVAQGQMYSINPTIYKPTLVDVDEPISPKKVKELYDKQEIDSEFERLTGQPDSALSKQFSSLEMQGDFLTQLQRAYVEQNTPKLRRMAHALTTNGIVGADDSVLDKFTKYVSE